MNNRLADDWASSLWGAPISIKDSINGVFSRAYLNPAGGFTCAFMASPRLALATFGAVLCKLTASTRLEHSSRVFQP